MLRGILITDNGTHPPEKWAEVSANMIVEVAPDARADAYILQGNIIKALTAAYGAAQNGEQLALDADGDGVLGSPLNPGEYVDDAVAAVIGAAKGTPYEAIFADEAVQRKIRIEVGTRIASILDIERAWFAVENDTATAKKYLQARAEIGGKLAHTAVKPSPKASQKQAAKKA